MSYGKCQMWKKSLLLTGVQTMLSLEEQTEHAIQRETDTNIPKTNAKRKFSFVRMAKDGNQKYEKLHKDNCFWHIFRVSKHI